MIKDNSKYIFFLKILVLSAIAIQSIQASAMQPGACGIQERPSANSDCAYTPGGSSSTQDAARVLQAVGAEMKKLEDNKRQEKILDMEQAEREEARTRTLDLSGGCGSAQEKGTTFANQIKSKAEESPPNVCQAARNVKLLGIITVRVAESCQEVATWQELRAQGQQMISESEQTISASCLQ